MRELKSPENFEKAYRDHQKFLRTVIYWLVRDDAVDDLVQESFVKAWRARANYEGKSSLKTWLYRIAVNCCYDYLSSKEKQGIQESEKLENLEARKDESLELKELIDLALLKMSFSQRESFVLFYKTGFTHKEIARLKDIPVGTVKSQIHSAKEIFTKTMEKEGVSA